MTNPTFGQKLDHVNYKARYGVYAIIPDKSQTQIILVQAPNGSWFLPGGEIEAGEDHLPPCNVSSEKNWAFQRILAIIMGKPMSTSTHVIAIPTSTTLLTCTKSPIFKN